MAVPGDSGRCDEYRYQRLNDGANYLERRARTAAWNNVNIRMLMEICSRRHDTCTASWRLTDSSDPNDSNAITDSDTTTDGNTTADGDTHSRANSHCSSCGRAADNRDRC